IPGQLAYLGGMQWQAQGQQQGKQDTQHVTTSEADRQAVGQGLAVGAPGRQGTHQQAGEEDGAQQSPLVQTRRAQRQVEAEMALQRRLRGQQSQIEQHQAEQDAGQRQGTGFQDQQAGEIDRKSVV